MSYAACRHCQLRSREEREERREKSVGALRADQKKRAADRRPVRELPTAYKLPSHVIARALAPVAISCRNYRLRTNLFAPTACRCADGTPRSSCPTNFDRTPAVGRDDSARRCRNYRLRTNSPVIVMKLPVGRGHVISRCRNYQVRTNSFVCTVCRFAVGWDMSQPYIGCFVYRGAFFACGLRGAQRRAQASSQ